MWLAGGYGDDKTVGIYQIDEKEELIIQAKGTTYFDVFEDKIVTIENVDGKGNIAIYQNHQCIYRYEGEYKPGCHIKVIEDKIVVCYYHNNCVQIFDHQLNLLKTIKYEQGKCHFSFLWDNYIGIVELEADLIHLYDRNLKEVSIIQFPKGSGPRHVVVSKDKEYVYVVSEYSKKCFVVDRNYKIIHSYPIIPVKTDVSTGSAIKLSENGKHLYTSCRYENYIAHFEIKDDELILKQYYPTSGKVPRDFELNKHEIMIGYQDSDYIEKIQLDHQGNLTDIIERYPLSKIVCIRNINN